MNAVAISPPLGVSTAAFAANIFIHAVGARTTLQLVRRAKQTDRVAAGFWSDVAGPLEAANQVLTFGLSTALIYAVNQDMLRTNVGTLD